MKNRSFVAAAVCISAAVFLFMTVEAFARVGGSRSFGSRGSRSMSTPTRPSQPSTPSSTSTSPSSTSTSATPTQGATPSQVPPPQTGGFMRGMMGGLAGGFLGSMLFGGLGGMGSGGLGEGGFGMLDFVLLGGLAYLGYRFFVKRRQEQAAWAPQGAGTTPGPYAAPAAVADTAGEDRDQGARVHPPDGSRLRREGVRGNGVGCLLPAAGGVDAPGPVAGVGSADRRDARHLAGGRGRVEGEGADQPPREHLRAQRRDHRGVAGVRAAIT